MAVGPSRKLVVILLAVVVRAATLVARDEALAHAIFLGACRRVSLTSEALNGVTHEQRGDALVAEFARASAMASTDIWSLTNRRARS